MVMVPVAAGLTRSTRRWHSCTLDIRGKTLRRPLKMRPNLWQQSIIMTALRSPGATSEVQMRSAPSSVCQTRPCCRRLRRERCV